MKRREFLGIVCQSTMIVTCAATPLYNLLNGSAKSRIYGHPKLIDDGSFELPTSPEEYSSIVYFDVKESELPVKLVTTDNIEGDDVPFILNEAGSYCAQYLGPFYGWSVS
jgi:hypothetical protein